MGPRLRVLGVGVLVGLVALLFVSPAAASGTWAYASFGHTQISISGR